MVGAQCISLISVVNSEKHRSILTHKKTVECGLMFFY